MKSPGVLHIVPLPGPEPTFAMILEVEPENEIEEHISEWWQAFAQEAGARSMIITNQDLVVLTHHPDGPPVPAGPCPSYMESYGPPHVCDLRAGHDGLHEETKPGTNGNPPQRATWGDRERFQQSAGHGFYSIATSAPPLDLKAAFVAGGYVVPEMTREELEEQLAGAERFNVGPYAAPPPAISVEDSTS